MNLATIEIPQEEAKQRLAEYRGALRLERRAMDQRIAAGYRAAAKGLPILKLSQSVAAGGYFDNGLPRIAVVRADATRCTVRVERWRGNTTSDLIFCDNGWPDNRGALVGEHTVRVTVPKTPEGRGWTGTTIVPIIPPSKRRQRLDRYHLLWEVEAWELIAPRDPALIKHIGGDLWAVHDLWDLTELERAVLSA